MALTGHTQPQRNYDFLNQKNCKMRKKKKSLGVCSPGGVLLAIVIVESLLLIISAREHELKQSNGGAFDSGTLNTGKV